jgi:hypothetical protein
VSAVCRCRLTSSSAGRGIAADHHRGRGASNALAPGTTIPGFILITALAAVPRRCEKRAVRNDRRWMGKLLQEEGGVRRSRVGDGAASRRLLLRTTEFKSARHFAAFLGLTPKQCSTGGRQRLGRGAGGSIWAKGRLFPLVLGSPRGFQGRVG